MRSSWFAGSTDVSQPFFFVFVVGVVRRLLMFVVDGGKAPGRDWATTPGRCREYIHYRNVGRGGAYQIVLFPLKSLLD